MRIYTLVAVLLGIFNNASCSGESLLNENNIVVYIDDGAIQCESKGKPVQQTAQILIEHNIKVTTSECGYLSGVAMPAQCGLGNINIHLHTINSRDLTEAQALGFVPVSELKHDDDIGYVISDCPER